MKTQLKLDILIKDINDNIEIYEKRRERNKKRALILKLSSIFGSALITVLLGLKSVQNYFISDIALILSALITVFNGIEGFYNHRGLWVKDVKTLAGLRELKRDLEFFVAGETEEKLSSKILTSYKDRLQNICNDDLKTWSKIKEEQIISESESQKSL